MASIYKLEPSSLFTVPTDDKVTVCKLCLHVAKPSDGINLGPLYQYGKPVTGEDGSGELEVYCAHYFCLLFSAGLSQRGQDEEVGIKGFLPDGMYEI